jgi:tetratricopeptide (TPR) repeat protein
MATQTQTAVDTYFFLCNPSGKLMLEDGEISTNQELCSYLQDTLSGGEFPYLSWSCANTKKIEVGDRAYLARSGSSPTGIIASGVVVEGLEDEQLRNQDSQYEDLSAAYIDYYDNKFYVCIRIDAVVDFDVPLEQRTLKQLTEFRDVNFQFQGGGKLFAPGNPIALDALAKAWKSHAMDCQAENRGRRLIDVLIAMGDAAREDKEFEEALGYYQEALDIDPDYAKALNKRRICESIIVRAKSAPPIITPPSASPSEPQTTKNELDSIREALEPEPSTSAEEERRRVLTYIVKRQGQTKFRQALLAAYNGKCAITGFDAEAALEAVHIIPYAAASNNDPTNGILLRADLHTLFDLNLLAIHPDTLRVSLHPTLQHTEYRPLHGKQMRAPAVETLRPGKKYLAERLQQCTWMTAHQP